jgi:geranylgeranyl pyrophosphate synthase
MFYPEELARLAPRMHPPVWSHQNSNGHDHSASSHHSNGNGASSMHANGQHCPALNPLAATETIAYDFLAKGGKHSRPFITLAVYDALTGGRATRDGAEKFLSQLSPSVKRCALSIEVFHKASLVHDDIQDDDEFRYGCPTLHRQHGTPAAINVGDYLIGLGYRLVTRESQSLGPATVAAILDSLAEAHMRLSEGQGAELVWRDSGSKQLTPADTLKIYALKTAPAFEAALHTGLCLAGPARDCSESLGQFAHHLGVAFQIINDLNDWHGDDHNKLIAAGDVIGGRPTLLWALALEGLNPPRRDRLKTLISQQPLTDENLREIRHLYEEAGAFRQSESLVDEYQQRAEVIAAKIEPPELSALLYFLIDLVLQRRQLPTISSGV